MDFGPSGKSDKMIHLYTGNGKGKTTAAIGQAIRAAGSGMRIVFAQFMKGNDTGELHILEKIPQIRILRGRQDFGFYRQMTAAERQALTEEHNRVLEEIRDLIWRKQCDMVILDEITYPVNWSLLDEKLLRDILGKGKDQAETAGIIGRTFLEVILTGRNPAGFLSDAADYVTEMKEIRHPYQKGVTARKGIEY